MFHFFQHLNGAFHGGGGGKLHHGEHEALVLVGQEGRGQTQEQKAHEDDGQTIDDQVTDGLENHAVH